ncbi:sodium-translocating pyrophosphatase [Planctomicrobium piriforme]|uniref:K(+)-insensitive pyrophosphate-energized proton pump n=1 Tax=Planctomicrobium piriforme TaxID=1576369 RepID=A0A1I3K9N9_9PLAN|nr:sodium-translocating pyrophosphatase [Planctomicrobium piriforme]SFI69199.1 K(+)-stimulated pyrophosphate-energized sodium pump [Planctomicrobium piriforme]
MSAVKRGLLLGAGSLLLLCSNTAEAGEADLRIAPFRPFGFEWWLMLGGMLVCCGGLAFGFAMYRRLKSLPVHRSMLEISELIYATCQAYLLTQGKFLLLLQVLVGGVMVYYFGVLAKKPAFDVAVILLFSVLGILGSYGVAWFGIRINTLANSRAAFGVLRGLPWPASSIPLQAGIAIGTVLISVELLLMLGVLLFLPNRLAGASFIGFAIGESLGASVLRIAGGIFTKIADIGSDLMKIVYGIQEDDARNPGVIADCTGDNAGDSVGPTADGFETYGVTGVALISFITLAIRAPGGTQADTDALQVLLLTWIFFLRAVMVLTSLGAYWINHQISQRRYASRTEMNFEAPLEQLVWMTSGLSIALTYAASYFLLKNMAGDPTLWWKLATIISCGTLAGAVIPALVRVFTSTKSRHVREVIEASREGGASLNILSGLIAGNFSCFWLGLAIVALMAVGNAFAWQGAQNLMISPQAASVFAFGLIAFGFLGMGPVTIAVDSYGPVTDNAQSVFELSQIESLPGIEAEIERDFGFIPQFAAAKHYLEDNDGAGNTFKATAKPVLIGTAVVGATTLVFAIIVMLTEGMTTGLENLSILHAPFLFGLILGGAVIYWFTGATMQAVTTGAYRAVEYIKQHIRLDQSGARASDEDSKRVVEICTQYAQWGMLNIFMTILCITLAFACFDNYLFIGYLIGLAVFGLYQAIFMANAGGAWDNAKKVVEVELKMKNTPLHEATIVGDTVGDPFKDTSSVSLNPVIKFSTLFGLLALEVAIQLSAGGQETLRQSAAWVFLALALVFVYRSFYSMRIKTNAAV